MSNEDKANKKPNLPNDEAPAGRETSSNPSPASQYSVQRQGERDRSSNDPGPNNTAFSRTNPDDYLPPPTDNGLPAQFWSSFSVMHRRVQEGGWSRQVNVKDFPLASELAGVNMRLDAGGIRELHWHAADEWAIMLYGDCRLSALDVNGSPYVQDVKAGDLWYFPAGIPHSLQGTGCDGCEFLLVFNDAAFSEEDTTLISDWVKHVPRDVLAKNWSVPEGMIEEAISSLPESGHYIFQIPEPPSLKSDRSSASHGVPMTKTKFDFPMLSMKPQKETASGSVRIVDSTNFSVARDIAMAYVVLKPGGLRELHWHPDADEWQYYIAGNGRMTVFFNHSQARTANFNPGDVGAVPATFGHYVENIGSSDLVFLEMFKLDRYSDISLNDWMTHMPSELVTQHLRISEDVLHHIAAANVGLLPA